MIALLHPIAHREDDYNLSELFRRRSPEVAAAKNIINLMQGFEERVIWNESTVKALDSDELQEILIEFPAHMMSILPNDISDRMFPESDAKKPSISSGSSTLSTVTPHLLRGPV